jgi:osmotically-inducible protein OsmY
MDDETLRRLITNAFDSDAVFWSIVVEVDEGLVTLNGMVRNPAERRRADIIARALGAAAVDNRLRVDRGGARQPD